MSTLIEDSLLAAIESRNQQLAKQEESERKQIKLTPKGERFGDKIRRQLSDPDSSLSQAVKNLKTWKYIIKGRPTGDVGWSFESNIFGGVEAVYHNVYGMETEREVMSPYTWVKDCI